jgi:hypothetical protein
MAARENAGTPGKKSKKTVKPKQEHFNKDWDKDLWD